MQRLVNQGVWRQVSVLRFVLSGLATRQSPTVTPQTGSHLALSGPRWMRISAAAWTLPSAGPQKTATEDGQAAVPSPEEADPLQDRSVGLVQRFKRTLKQYGKVMVPVHLVTSSVWIGTFYYAAMKFSLSHLLAYIAVWLLHGLVTSSIFHFLYFLTLINPGLDSSTSSPTHLLYPTPCHLLIPSPSYLLPLIPSLSYLLTLSPPHPFALVPPHTLNSSPIYSLTSSPSNLLNLSPSYLLISPPPSHLLNLSPPYLLTLSHHHPLTSSPFPTVHVFRGVNVVPYLEYIGFPERLVKLLENSQSGCALTAYAMYKIATPARYTVTLGGTSLSVKYLRQHGYLSTPPPVKEYLQDKMEETKERLQDKMEETKERLQDKMEETKDKFTGKLLETKDRLHDKMEETKDRLHDKMEETKDSFRKKQE